MTSRKPTLRLILGDQLNAQHRWFTDVDAATIYVLMEVRQETDYVLHHAQKILAIFAAMGIAPWSLGRLPVRRFPLVLRLPDFLFRLASRAGPRIDSAARSSMWEDLERGRATEIDELQGKIVALGHELGISTPANDLVLAAVRKAEGNGPGSPRLIPSILDAMLRS